MTSTPERRAAEAADDADAGGECRIISTSTKEQRGRPTDDGNGRRVPGGRNDRRWRSRRSEPEHSAPRRRSVVDECQTVADGNEKKTKKKQRMLALPLRR